MSSQTVASGSSGAQSETTVVNDIPEALNKILLIVVKNFFSNEHFLVVYYIMRAQCIREENLRARLQFDQKMLRQLLASLIRDKLVKDRLITQKNENNRTVSIYFYFINYRAVLNVVRYKIDHIRIKLETSEQMDTNRAHYKCTQCSSTYDMLEINMILNIETGRLVCWRCHGEVLADESVAPSQATRTAVARFNEQMAPLFSHICALNGIQLAPHLLEPDISKYLEDDKARELQAQQQMDFTSGGSGGGANRIQLGGVAHSYHNAATINYQHGDQVTVDLNADINNRPVEEAKQVPLWLQDNAIGGEEATHNEQILSKVNVENDESQEETGGSSKSRHRKGLSLEYLKEIEFGDRDEAAARKKSENGGVDAGNGLAEPEPKRRKLENGDDEQKMEVDVVASEEVGGGEEEEDDEENMIHVGGQLVRLSQVTVKMVEEEMSDEEKHVYCMVVEQLYAF